MIFASWDPDAPALRDYLGDMTLYLSLCRQAQGLFSGLFYNINSLYESGLFMSNLFGFLVSSKEALEALQKKG